MATIRRLTEAQLRADFSRLSQQEKSYRQHADNMRRQLDDLKARATADGLVKVYRELEAPPVSPPRVEEPTVRVRILESFSTEWAGLPVYGVPDCVTDLPRGLVEAAPHLFEPAADAPLTRMAWPR